jgi:hypothetical protein
MKESVKELSLNHQFIEEINQFFGFFSKACDQWLFYSDFPPKNPELGVLQF